MLALLYRHIRRWLSALCGLGRRRVAVRFLIRGLASPKSGRDKTPKKAYLDWANLVLRFHRLGGDIMADIVDLKVTDDGLLTVLPIDSTGGPAAVTPGTIKATSGDSSVIGDGVLVGTDDPGQTAFAFRCENKGQVGQQATLTVTAKNTKGKDMAPATLVFRIVETPPDPTDGVGFTVSGQAVPKV